MDYIPLMSQALALAKIAAQLGEVPVGCVIADSSGNVIARGHNRRELNEDPTAHAEIIAMREAARVRGHWRLNDLTLVVTLEPCPMCAGALVQSRIARLVFGADDPKAGAVTSLFDLVRDPRLPHRVEVHRGVLADDCAALLRSFFTPRRYTPERQGARVDEWGGLENR
jgi:tRNA(adenine34) deaminase